MSLAQLVLTSFCRLPLNTGKNLTNFTQFNSFLVRKSSKLFVIITLGSNLAKELFARWNTTIYIAFGTTKSLHFALNLPKYIAQDWGTKFGLRENTNVSKPWCVFLMTIHFGWKDPMLEDHLLKKTVQKDENSSRLFRISG